MVPVSGSTENIAGSNSFTEKSKPTRLEINLVQSWTTRVDTLLRWTKLALLNPGASVVASTTYGYDVASRLLSGSDGTNSATYGYLANSPLVEHIIFRQNSTVRLTRTNQYDNLNRVKSVAGTPSADSPISYAYSYNDANQRTQVTSKYAGDCFYTQLITRHSYFDRFGPYFPVTVQYTQGAYWLDNQESYINGSARFSSQTGTATLPHFFDEPSLQLVLTAAGEAQIIDGFKTYLRFQPLSEGSIPITLRLILWSWKGKATKASFNAPWVPDPSSNAGGPTDFQSNDFPFWQKILTNQ